MLELREYSVDEVPIAEWAYGTAISFAADIERSWIKLDPVPATSEAPQINLYTCQRNRDFWAARISIHTDVSYETFRKLIMEDHTKNESQYIDMVADVQTLTVPPLLAEWQSHVVRYKFPSPLQSREMAIWIIAKETQPGRQFMVLTLPRKVPVSCTKGLYVSVEVVEKTEDGKIRWVMAQSSDAGGWLPKWAQRRAVPGAIAKDVPAFLNWAKEKS